MVSPLAVEVLTHLVVEDHLRLAVAEGHPSPAEERPSHSAVSDYVTLIGVIVLDIVLIQFLGIDDVPSIDDVG
jgi:hypothetical protein